MVPAVREFVGCESACACSCAAARIAELETALRATTAATRDALEAAVRKGFGVHWDLLEPSLLKAHDDAVKVLDR